MVRHHAAMFLLAAVLLAPCPVLAQLVPPGYHVETLASGLAAPCAFDFMPDGGVVFTEQNTGGVRLLRAGGGVQVVPVITVPGVVGGGERGLLGIAFDRLYPSRPYLFVLHSAGSPSRTRISRFTLNAVACAGGADLLADPTSRLDLLDAIPDAASNHNGGTVRFASDGTLIASLGDDAFPCGAQDSTGLRGVILRMSVNRLGLGPGVASIAQLTPLDNPYAASPDSNARLVLARGLRNPFRVQCDEASPWLMIGDVGNSQREEFDLLALPGDGVRPLGAAPPGANFGWPYREGSVAGSLGGACAAAPDSLAEPAFDYDRTSFSSGASIIAAGFMPPIITTLAPGILPVRSLPPGMYFSDYYTGAITRLDFPPGGTSWQVAPAVPGQPTADHFAEGFRAAADWRVRGQSLWFVRQSVNFAANTGSIGRIVADELPPPPPPAAGELRFTALGTPAQGSVEFLVTGGTATPRRLAIHDARGRMLRHYDGGALRRAPDGLRLTWDGFDGQGGKVRPGVYWARLEGANGTRTTRIVFLR